MRRYRTTGVLLASLLGLAVVWPGLAQATVVYTYTILQYPGAQQTQCNGITDGGVVTGAFSDVAGQRSFIWSGGLFTTTFDYPGSSATTAQGINNAGDIVGVFLDPISSQLRGFLLHAGVFTEVDPGFQGETEVWAAGINDAGDIVGYFDDATGRHGFILRGGTATVIDVPPGPPSTYTFAYDINNLGQIVVRGDTGISSSYLATLTGTTLAFSPVTIPSPGGPVFGLNDVGQMVGSGGYVLQKGVLTTVAPSGYLGEIGTRSINNHGVIVGIAALSGNSGIEPFDCFIAHPHVILTNIVVHQVIGLFAHVGPGDPVTRLDFIVELGPESNGIDPSMERVALGIGGVALSIPPGSFRRERDGGFRFRGRVDGVELAMEITPGASPSGAPAYEVSVEAVRLPRAPRGFPVTLNLTIGDDMGSVQVDPTE